MSFYRNSTMDSVLFVDRTGVRVLCTGAQTGVKMYARVMGTDYKVVVTPNICANSKTSMHRTPFSTIARHLDGLGL